MAEAFERTDVPNELIPALRSILGAHAMPVWGWGQRPQYERLVMEGPSLDQWVRTAGLWAEMERMCWEWEQLVAGLALGDRDSLVSGVTGDLAERTVAAQQDWVDLMFRAVALGTVGEFAVRALSESSYAPLKRYARTMVAYKRGQTADGGDAIRETVSLRQLDGAGIEERATVWQALAVEHAELINSEETAYSWVNGALAMPFDLLAARNEVEARLDKYLRG